MVIYKVLINPNLRKTVSRQPKFSEGCTTIKNAGPSKFKVYSEKKVSDEIGDSAAAKIPRTSLVSNKGGEMASTKTKVGVCGAPVTRSSNEYLDKARVRRKALADVSNIKGQSSRIEKPSGLRISKASSIIANTASSNRSLPGKVKASITGDLTASHTSVKASTQTQRTYSNFGLTASHISAKASTQAQRTSSNFGLTASNTSTKVSTQAQRTSSNFRTVQVNKTMETATRKSFPVMRKANQLYSSVVQGDTRSSENSARKNGFPVKTRAGGKLIPQVSTLKGKLMKEKVNDDFTQKVLRNQTNKDSVGGVRKSVKAIVKTSLQIPNQRKTLKSKSICSLPNSLSTTSAQSVKVASSSIAKSFKPMHSGEEVTKGAIPAEGNENMKLQSPESSKTTTTKKSIRRKSYTSSLISGSKLLELRNEVREYEQLPNIDDGGDPLDVVEYVDDIYEYYWIMEAQINTLESYMVIQTEVTPKMRGILVNWLVEVHLKFDLMPETLYLSVALLDRYLPQVTLKKSQFQLVGLVSLLLASKYEDFWHPRVKDLISISAESYSRKQMLEMEKSILKKLKFRLNVPTPYVFLLRFLKASQSDKRLEHLAFYLIELCLVDYEALRFKPSLLCASAVYVGRCTLNEVPAWSSLLGKHARYEELQIRTCAEMILRIHKAASTGLLKVTYDKYMQPEFGGAAAVRPLDRLPSL